MNHFATPDFWYCHRHLPDAVRELADHPSVRLKKVGSYWSARVGLHSRALARERPEGLVWFWIGHHGEYGRLIRS